MNSVSQGIFCGHQKSQLIIPEKTYRVSMHSTKTLGVCNPPKKRMYDVKSYDVLWNLVKFFEFQDSY